VNVIVDGMLEVILLKLNLDMKEIIHGFI